MEIEKRKKEMGAPIIHLLLDEQILTDLCRHCDETSHAETCTRHQMLYLLALLPQADLYLQNEIQLVFYPTLTRAWCSKGRHGQGLVEASVDNRKVYRFGLVDWRDSIVAPGRTANVFWTCAVISAVRLRQTKVLPCHKFVPQNQLGSL